MDIIGFVLVLGILLYFLFASMTLYFAVGISIQVGSGKSWWYVFPTMLVVAVVCCLWALFVNAPFSVTML